MKVIHVIPFLWRASRVLTDLCISQSTHHDVTIVTSGNARECRSGPSTVVAFRPTVLSIVESISLIAILQCIGRAPGSLMIASRRFVRMLFIAIPGYPRPLQRQSAM